MRRGIVIRDKLGRYKSRTVRRDIRATGATFLFPPKYAPDRNPIEPLSAKRKHWLHTPADRIRDAPCTAIARILDTVSPAECADDLVNSGHDRT